MDAFYVIEQNMGFSWACVNHGLHFKASNQRPIQKAQTKEFISGF